MIQFIKYLSVVALLIACAACGESAYVLQGGSEFGNPPKLRAIEGTVPSRSLSRAEYYSGSIVPCVADTLVATDSFGERFSIDIADDCRFEGTLAADETYALELVFDEQLVAPVLFEAELANESTPFLDVPFSLAPLDLGQLTVEETAEGPVAYPENEPASDDAEPGGTQVFVGEHAPAASLPMEPSDEDEPAEDDSDEDGDEGGNTREAFNGEGAQQVMLPPPSDPDENEDFNASGISFNEDPSYRHRTHLDP